MSTMDPNDILLVHISGDGQVADGPLLGFLDFAQGLVREYGIRFIPHAHDDVGIAPSIFADPAKKKIITGFSFGGDEANNVELAFAKAGLTYDSLCLMDPKPKSFFRWWNPFYCFPLPTAATFFQCFYSGFGRPFIGNLCSTHLFLQHPDFPGNLNVHYWIEGRIRSLLSLPPSAQL